MPLRSSCGQNRLDEIFRDVPWYASVIVGERALAEFDGLLVAGEISLTIDAQAEVMVERATAVCRQFARQIVGHEVGELATRHDAATSQKILIAPLGFCKRAKSSW